MQGKKNFTYGRIKEQKKGISRKGEKEQEKEAEYDIICECFIILTEVSVYCRHRHVTGLVGQVGNVSHFISHVDEFGVSLEQAIGYLQRIEKLTHIVCLLLWLFLLWIITCNPHYTPWS